VNCARPNPSGLLLRIPARLLAAGLGFLFSFLGAPRARCQDEEKTPTLKVSTDVVNVYAIVRDKKGRLIANLNKEDFEISEDNVVQTIRYYSRETDTPLTLGLMIDTSPSQGRVLEVEKEEGKAFIRQVLRPKDLAFALHFDLEVELLQDFTNDARLLSRAIDESVINGGGQGPLPTPLPASSGAGATHLYDAIYLAANELLKNEVGRKVLILLTDGEDQGSKVKLNDALEASQKAGVIIYSVAIIDRAFYFGQPTNFSGDSVLRKLSEETGGRVIEVSRTRDTAAAFQQIAEELRTEYLLGYAPANPRHDGSYHKIRVRLRNGDAKVQARRGYYAPTE
jgi:VWFA-related protein